MARRTLVLLLFLAACTTARVPLVERGGDGPDGRFDEPNEAAQYRALKHQGSDDPYRSLSVAREAMRTMRRYSTADDRMIDPRAPGIRTLAGDPARPIGTWKFLGPGNIGGRTRVLVIDPTSPAVMYTGGVSGGIWKTLNAGQEWFPIGDDLANIAINSLVMHPTDPNTLYAGTGEGYFREVQRGTALPLRGDGIFVTHDAGETWTRLASTDSEDFHFVNDLVVSTHDPSHLYAATRTGVWRSLDAGETWERVLPTTVTGGCLDLAWRGDQAGDYLFASCGTFERATVYRSKNAQADASWEPVFSEPNMGRTSLAIAPSDPSVIYALAASNEPGPFHQGLLGVFRSTDDGDSGTWTAQLRNDDPTYGSRLLTNLIALYGDICNNWASANVTMGWYCNTIAVDPADAERVWVGGVDLFRSDNGGRTWGVASYWWVTEGSAPAFVHADQHAIVFHPRYDGSSNRTAYFTNDGGIFRTDDALAAPATGDRAMCSAENSSLQFVPLNNSYGVTQFYHGAVSPDGNTFIAGAQDNGTLMGSIADGPNRWKAIMGGDGGYVAIDPNDPDFIYAEYQWAGLGRSSDGGVSFRGIRSSIAGAEFLFVTPFTLDPNDTRRLWLGGRTLWRSPNRGDSWIPASTPLPALVSAVAVQPGNSAVVVAGTSGGHILRSTNASTANASTGWPMVQPRPGFVSWVAFDPTDPNVVFATYAGFGGAHVWMSTDNGVTWTPRDGSGDGALPDIPVHSIAVDPSRPDRLYLGTDLGVFVSLDRGQTWAVENSGFANAVTETVLIGKGENGPAVYAFTHGRGAWRAELVFQASRRRRPSRH
jgi:hypothetical protein